MYQEFKDEILDPSLQPDENPRYTIKNNAGIVINDNVQIEMKTPVVQNPTPLNRATMANIQGDLYTQDRYNTPTYSGSAMTLALPLSSYEKNKIIKIIAPATISSPTLNINKLGAKTVNGRVKAGEKYELIYNGTSFDIEKGLADKITFSNVTEFEVSGLNIVDINEYSFSLAVETPVSTKMTINGTTDKKYLYITDSGADGDPFEYWDISTNSLGFFMFRLGVINKTPILMGRTVGSTKVPTETSTANVRQGVLGGILRNTTITSISKFKFTFTEATSGSISIYRR